MPILISCPSCGRKLNAQDILVGRKVKCPKCGFLFVVETPGAPASTAPKEAFSAAALPLGGRKRPVVDGFDLVEEEAGDGRGVSLPHAGVLPAAGSNVPLGLGVAALLLGCCALLFSLVPFVRSAQANVGIVSLPLGGLGLLLGLGGLAVAILRKGQGIGFPIAGSACSLVAVAVAVVWLGWLRKDVQHAAAPASSSSQAAATPRGGDLAQNEKGSERADPAAKESEWIDASRAPVALGDLSVRTGMVLVGAVKVKDVLGEQTETPRKYLGIQLFISNASKTRKIDYRGWSGAASAAGLTDALKGLGREGGGLADVMAVAGKNAAAVKDNFGNSYKRFTIGLGEEIPGQIIAETSIYPEKTVEDLLVFEPPLENIEYLHLELPAAACGMTGALHLEIPQSMIRR